MAFIDNIRKVFKSNIIKDVPDVEDADVNNFIDKITNMFTSNIPVDFEEIISDMFNMISQQTEFVLEKIIPIVEEPTVGVGAGKPLRPLSIEIGQEPIEIATDTTKVIDTDLRVLSAEVITDVTGALPDDTISDTVKLAEGDLTGIKSDTIITDTTVSTGRTLFTASSAQTLDAKAIEQRVLAHKIIHISITTVLATISIAVEVITLGQMDKIIENLLVLYNLLPSSTIYNSVQGQDLEASLLRPYRYLSESANRTQIPSPSDMIVFLTKEQLADNPEDSMKVFKRFMGYHGFDDFWANAYWGAHWILPATSQLYDMHGRGLIDLATLEKQLEINDIKPEWIPKMVELAFNLPNKTETRMINRTRKMSDAKIDKILVNARITEEYRDDYKFWVQNQELDTLNVQEVKQVRDMFIKGYIDDNDFSGLLDGSIYSTEERKKIISIDNMKKDEKINDIRLRTLLLERRKNTLTDLEFEVGAMSFIKDERLIEVYLEQEKARLGLLVDIELGSPITDEEGA